MYKVNRLVYYESFHDPSDAISRKKELKGWRRSKKNALVETLNPKWADFPGRSFSRCEVPRRLRDSG